MPISQHPRLGEADERTEIVRKATATTQDARDAGRPLLIEGGGDGASASKSLRNRPNAMVDESARAGKAQETYLSDHAVI
mmetsp:Transcript_23752/g.54973  ORF Transcript_23752/g.54973 Transcript_23752/m.54973 type:complete len:80 (-) Transcript_23752:43-282(-)